MTISTQETTENQEWSAWLEEQLEDGTTLHGTDETSEVAYSVPLEND